MSANAQKVTFEQWLKYKFGGPGTLKIWGRTVRRRGPSQPARTINGCVGPGNARQQFLGAQELRSPEFPLTLTTAVDYRNSGNNTVKILHKCISPAPKQCRLYPTDTDVVV